jgi:outer membrane immunogenic protein
MKTSLLLAALLTSCSGAAFAADLPNTKEAPNFLAPAPVSTWTGFYAGVNAGYGFSADPRDTGEQTYYANTSGDDSSTEDHGPGGPSWQNQSKLSGALGGAQIGYNLQINPFAVIGIEADFQGSGLSGSSSTYDSTHMTLLPFPVGGPNEWPVAGTAGVSQHVNWYGTLRGRLGWVATPDLLLYGTGGFAYGQVHQNFSYVGGFLADPALGFMGSHWNGDASSSSIRVGWTAGAGLEWKIPGWQNWSVKAEYLYTDLGSTTVSLSAPAFRNSNGTGGRTVEATNSVDAKWHTVRVGLNYHFN